MPHVIKDPKTGAEIAIIDTAGTYQNLDTSDAKLLLTKSKLIVRRGERDSQTYDISGVQSFYLDQSKVDGWVAMAKTWFIPVLYPLALIFSFIFRTIQILIYALVGLAFAKMLKATLDYKTLMRLSAIAITPVLVLNLIFEFLPGRIPWWSILGIVVALAYLFFAVKVNAEPEDAPQYQPPNAYPSAP
jgi:hypothetical protein